MAARDKTQLIERLLADPEFRARFQDDPRAAAAEAGIELPDELANGGGGMQTLDFRESKSSFAGALMAAAVEGIGLYELGQHVLPGIEDAQAAETPTHRWDPSEFGQAGAGGSPTPETLDLLQNHNVTFDADGIADLKAGKIDPRIVSVIDSVAEKHRITISAMVSDHDKLTAGGSVSNHYYGRAMDIAVVDGRPVSPGNLAARQLAVALTNLPASIRPSEIGSPWPLPGAADFSDAAHQNHIHVAFDDPISPNWAPPAGSAEASTEAPEPADAPDPPEVDDSAQEDAQEDADAASAIVRSAAAPVDPDDLEGNLDDEDGGADEADGSNEDEADEGGGEDDDGGTDDEEADGEDEEGADGEDDEDEGQDDPGEGSNGEDATDDNAGDSNDDGSDGSDSSDGTDSGSGDPPDLGGIDTDYPGDDAPKEQIAAWMASAAEKRGVPPELPVMASLTESSLRNLDYGDADSIGYFQMRTSIWDQGEYAGYGKQPEKQLDWFLDHAEAIKKQRLERGQSVDDPNQYGDWIADIERPAAQYRGRYQLRLEEARALLSKV